MAAIASPIWHISAETRTFLPEFRRYPAEFRRYRLQTTSERAVPECRTGSGPGTCDDAELLHSYQRDGDLAPHQALAVAFTLRLNALPADGHA
jgi:hypothetical protein